MTRRAKLWFLAALIFTLINVAGGVFAALGGEWMHTLVHVVLTLAGVYAAARLARPEATQVAPATLETQQRLQQLQQSVDAMALEVERVGEAQRYIAKVAAERAKNAQPKENP